MGKNITGQNNVNVGHSQPKSNGYRKEPVAALSRFALSLPLSPSLSPLPLTSSGGCTKPNFKMFGTGLQSTNLKWINCSPLKCLAAAKNYDSTAKYKRELISIKSSLQYVRFISFSSLIFALSFLHTLSAHSLN